MWLVGVKGEFAFDAVTCQLAVKFGCIADGDDGIGVAKENQGRRNVCIEVMQGGYINGFLAEDSGTFEAARAGVEYWVEKDEESWTGRAPVLIDSSACGRSHVTASRASGCGNTIHIDAQFFGVVLHPCDGLI